MLHRELVQNYVYILSSVHFTSIFLSIMKNQQKTLMIFKCKALPLMYMKKKKCCCLLGGGVNVFVKNGRREKRVSVSVCLSLIERGTERQKMSSLMKIETEGL